MKLELCEYVKSKGITDWNKVNTLERLDKASDIFVEKDEHKICGIAILQKVDNNKFHCSLLVADSSKYLVQLVQAFKDLYPDGEIVSAFRRKKEKIYSKPQNLVNKLLNYGRLWRSNSTTS